MNVISYEPVGVSPRTLGIVNPSGANARRLAWSDTFQMPLAELLPGIATEV